MKTSISVFTALLIVIGGTYATGEVPPNGNRDPFITIDNDIDTSQSQQVSVIGGGDSSSSAQGGDASSDSVAASSSGATINTTSNYETRTPPITTFPPYLPYWNHGGWGTMKAYFPNGPNGDDRVYERIFNPDNTSDMKELRGIMESLEYEGLLEGMGGILNGVGAIFGGPDNFHHGRGFEIASSLIRTRRPRGKPLLVFIDSNVDTGLLEQAGYAYVGKISLEGKVNRNWDHVYEAAVAEALPWNVDILLISGGMKGVTAGSTVSAGAGGAYSQTNYSLSLLGSVTSGITEGKGKAIISAQGYRYWPNAVNRRRIPQAFYNKVRAKLAPALKPELEQKRESVELQVSVAPTKQVPVRSVSPPVRKREPAREQQPVTEQESVGEPELVKETEPVRRQQPVRQYRYVRQQPQGLEISQELFDMTGFTDKNQIAFLTVK